eukprot:gene19278-biopygen23477
MAAPQAPLKWGIGIMLHRRCLPAFHRPRGGQGEATACASRAGNTHSVDALRTRVPALCPGVSPACRCRVTPHPRSSELGGGNGQVQKANPVDSSFGGVFFSVANCGRCCLVNPVPGKARKREPKNPGAQSVPGKNRGSHQGTQEIQ